MKKIITVFLIFLSSTTIGQMNQFCVPDSFPQIAPISKKYLKRIFKENAKGTSFNFKKRNWSKDYQYSWHSTFNVWQTCNEDSLYYNSDTIRLINNRYAYFDIRCKEILEWNLFKNGKSIGYSGGKYYQEPPISFPIKTPFKKIKWIEGRSDTYLVLKKSDYFKVIGFGLVPLRNDYERLSYQLTLLRISENDIK